MKLRKLDPLDYPRRYGRTGTYVIRAAESPARRVEPAFDGPPPPPPTEEDRRLAQELLRHRRERMGGSNG